MLFLWILGMIALIWVITIIAPFVFVAQGSRKNATQDQKDKALGSIVMLVLTVIFVIWIMNV